MSRVRVILVGAFLCVGVAGASANMPGSSVAGEVNVIAVEVKAAKAAKAAKLK